MRFGCSRQFEQLENTSSSGKSVVNLLQLPSNASSGHQIPLGMFLLVQSHTFGQKPKVLYHPNISTNDTNTTHLQDQSSSSSIPTSIRHLHRSLPVGYRSRYLGVCDSCHGDSPTFRTDEVTWSNCMKCDSWLVDIRWPWALGSWPWCHGLLICGWGCISNCQKHVPASMPSDLSLRRPAARGWPQGPKNQTMLFPKECQNVSRCFKRLPHAIS